MYFGQSWNIDKRWSSHRRCSSKKNLPIIKSLKKYGHNTHFFEVAHELPTDVEQSVLDEYEQLYICLYRSAKYKMLNVCDGGLGHKGAIPWNKGKKGLTKWTEERRMLMINKAIGRKMPPPSEAWRKKQSDSHKGKPAPNKGTKGLFKHTEEHKKKISLLHKGNKYSVGRKMGEKTRQAIAKANIGSKRTDEQKRKISEARTLRPNRGGVKNKGIVRTDENKRKISESLKLRTDNKGELHNMAKITNEIVKEIRSKYIPKIYPSRRLAKEYGLSKTNILSIVNNKTWKNI